MELNKLQRYYYVIHLTIYILLSAQRSRWVSRSFGKADIRFILML
jgi:hypothetical protein